MPVLSEYCLPLVRTGGEFVAMKSVSAFEEIDSAKRAVKFLGGEIGDIHSFSLFDKGERNIIRIKKISQTPTAYPRKSAKIASNPL